MRTIAILALAFAVARAEDDAVKKDMKALEGEWTMVSGTSDGNDMPEDMLKTAKRTFKDGVTTVEIGGMVYLKAKISIDPSKKVKTVNYDVTEGVNKDKKVLGIYEIDGDTVKFFSKPGDERPMKFESKAGSGQVLSVWKRATKDKK